MTALSADDAHLVARLRYGAAMGGVIGGGLRMREAPGTKAVPEK